VARNLLAVMLGLSFAGFLATLFLVVVPARAARAQGRGTRAITAEPIASPSVSVPVPVQQGALRVSVETGALDPGAPELHSIVRRHRDKGDEWVTYEQIPRSPDRPMDYDAYRYPVPPGIAGGRHSVSSGYDLDMPDGIQRRGSFLNMVGHGGVDLPQVKGFPVRLVDLDHQVGKASVIYVGEMFGTTVVTKHTRREGGALREYLVIFGHLGSVAPGVKTGARFAEGDVVGEVGNSGSPLLIHLHVETRRLREGVDARRYEGWHLLSVSVVCDPRNVMPLKQAK